MIFGSETPLGVPAGAAGFSRESDGGFSAFSGPFIGFLQVSGFYALIGVLNLSLIET